MKTKTSPGTSLRIGGTGCQPVPGGNAPERARFPSLFSAQVGTARRAVRAALSAAQPRVARSSALARAFRPLYGRGHRRRDVPTTERARKVSAAFTLIELMVVVVILGILAVTIIPQFIGTTYDAKVSAAKSNIAELQSAVERFYVHMDRYPTADEGLKVLTEAPADGADKWRGPYIKELRMDPWGHPFEYRYPGTHHTTSYDIWSRGADGADGGEGQGADIGNW